MTFTTRFAPSPSGPLHLGHAYSALLAQGCARAQGGRFLLRIDDIDRTRARDHWERQICDDLTWLGVSWDAPVRRQSDHLADYDAALDRLARLGLLYPCSCKRRDIEAAASAPQEGAPAFGPDGRIYPGTCRGRPMAERQDSDALRLDLSRVTLPEALCFEETGPAHAGRHPVTRAALMREVGDPVLARPHMAGSYHLSVVVDDHEQDITHVIRGADLFQATFLHVALQALLGLPVPVYHHHALIRDAQGKRLAKRDDARAIARYRADGLSPADVRALVGL